jgi:hypothetical protein
VVRVRPEICASTSASSVGITARVPSSSPSASVCMKRLRARSCDSPKVRRCMFGAQVACTARPSLSVRVRVRFSTPLSVTAGGS